jgi:NAD(P)H-dependent FMN reductase
MKHNDHIAVVVGSLRQDSFNKKLAHALIQIAPDDFTFSFINIGDLPLYNQDDDGQSVHRSEHTAQAWLSNICAMYCRI